MKVDHLARYYWTVCSATWIFLNSFPVLKKPFCLDDDHCPSIASILHSYPDWGVLAGLAPPLGEKPVSPESADSHGVTYLAFRAEGLTGSTTASNGGFADSKSLLKEHAKKNTRSRTGV